LLRRLSSLLAAEGPKKKERSQILSLRPFSESGSAMTVGNDKKEGGGGGSDRQAVGARTDFPISRDRAAHLASLPEKKGRCDMAEPRYPAESCSSAPPFTGFDRNLER